MPALAAVDLGLLDSLVQHLGRTADLRGDRHDGLPARPMRTLAVENHPHRTLADLRGKLANALGTAEIVRVV